MNNIYLELNRVITDGYEKTILYEDGTAHYEKSRNNNIVEFNDKKIDVIDEIKSELTKAIPILPNVCETTKPTSLPIFEISLQDTIYYSMDLYMDLYLIIKYNTMKKLSIFTKNEKLLQEIKKNKTKEEMQKMLDKLEKAKPEIDISDTEISSSIFEDKAIIKFDLSVSDTIKMGESRFFSKFIDISDNIEIPKYLEFLGQMNLSEISVYDTNGLLPKTGYLYFFLSPERIENTFYEFCKVIYSNNDNLVRKDIKVAYDYEDTLRLTNIKPAVENIESRYYITDAGNKEMDSFAGEELNKVYGIYTDCQKTDEEILKISSKYIILLQLGSSIFGEGVFSFLITEEDLKNQNFNNIIFNYSQS